MLQNHLCLCIAADLGMRHDFSQVAIHQIGEPKLPGVSVVETIAVTCKRFGVEPTFGLGDALEPEDRFRMTSPP